MIGLSSATILQASITNAACNSPRSHRYQCQTKLVGRVIVFAFRWRNYSKWSGWAAQAKDVSLHSGRNKLRAIETRDSRGYLPPYSTTYERRVDMFGKYEFASSASFSSPGEEFRLGLGHITGMIKPRRP